MMLAIITITAVPIPVFKITDIGHASYSLVSLLSGSAGLFRKERHVVISLFRETERQINAELNAKPDGKVTPVKASSRFT